MWPFQLSPFVNFIPLVEGGNEGWGRHPRINEEEAAAKQAKPERRLNPKLSFSLPPPHPSASPNRRAKNANSEVVPFCAAVFVCKGKSNLEGNNFIPNFKIRKTVGGHCVYQILFSDLFLRPSAQTYFLLLPPLRRQDSGTDRRTKKGVKEAERRGRKEGEISLEFLFPAAPFFPERQQRNLHIPRGDLFPALFLREKKCSGCLSRFNGTFFPYSGEKNSLSLFFAFSWAQHFIWETGCRVSEKVYSETIGPFFHFEEE